MNTTKDSGWVEVTRVVGPSSDRCIASYRFCADATSA